MRKPLVAWLAVRDLRHEWILSLCLMLAVAAVVAPLLLLLGLKYGTISTLRERLVEDPVYREIRPVRTREYTRDWFDALRARPEVAFVVPTILPASSIIGVGDAATGRVRLLDLIPTAPGDPLIEENGGQVPGPGQCVLSAAAAELLGVSQGETIRAEVTRSRGGRREAVRPELRVISVLNPGADPLERMYAPLDFVLDVESYKEGHGAPDRGWPGGTPRPYPSFDGVVVALPARLDPVSETGLVINTGLTDISALAPPAFRQLVGLPLPEGMFAYDLTVAQGVVHLSSYRALKDKLRGRGAVLLPYAASARIELVALGDVTVAGFSPTPVEASRLGISSPPWPSLQADLEDRALTRILLPGDLAVRERVQAKVAAGEASLAFGLQVAGVSPTDVALVPVRLIGILRTAQERRVAYDPGPGEFRMARTGFHGFRVYTRDIDDVLTMARRLRSQGIEVIAQVEAIERIQVLDRGLTRLFWLVAIAGVAGGMAALIASLYANVERKKQEISVLRLVGLSRADVFLFPVFEATGIAVLSLVAAVSLYLALASLINHVFAEDLAVGQQICTLPPGYVLAAMLTTVIAAVVGSLLAAWRATLIEPGEALRYE